MSVKKIFITLITIVACVMIGALVLNVLLPNAAVTLVNSAEDMIYNATGMSFNFNGDSHAGGVYSAATGQGKNQDDTGTAENQAQQVEGF